MIELFDLDAKQAHKVQRVRVITAKRESLLAAKLSIQTPTGTQVTARRLIQCGDRVLARDIFACVILSGGGLARVAIHRRTSE
jgi:hypothetical protein